MTYKSRLKGVLFIIVLLLSIVVFTSCGSNSDSSKVDSEKNAIEATEDNDSTEKESDLDVFNDLAKSSETTKELYVTGPLKVGKDGDIKPGIYDLTVTGGSGNIMGERAKIDYLYINWVAAAKTADSMGYPSTIRILLFEGDTVELSDISKVIFTAVPEKVEMTNNLGQGEYVVGRDIAPGVYKLSTNGKMDKEYDNLGWDIQIVNYSRDETRDQSFNPGNSDVVVKLEEGEVVSTSYDNVDENADGDAIKLIFTPMEQ